jgi:LacI family transcriptional regulator
MDAITIYDIAKAAHVSPATVSKALNSRHDVSDSMREHVHQIALEMGYHPNAQARSLKLRRSYLIGVVYEEEGQWVSLDHPLFLPVLNAFKKRMEHSGYEIMFLSRGSMFQGGNLLSHVFSRQLDGLLLLDFSPKELPGLLEASVKIPIVACDSVVSALPSVVTDNASAAQQAVRYLFSLGHTRIAHIAGPSGGVSPAGSERLEGYVKGLQECGLPYDVSLVEQAQDWSPRSGKSAFDGLLVKNNGMTFDALFVAADSYIMGILKTCAQMGVSIPKDLSVIGFDDAQWTGFLQPGFTTFKQDKELLGDTSAGILLDLIDGKKRDGLTRIPAELIIRGSCKHR